MPQPRSSRKCGSRQIDLFPRSKRPTIPLADDHPLVVLADTVDWTEMEARAQQSPDAAKVSLAMDSRGIGPQGMENLAPDV